MSKDYRINRMNDHRRLDEVYRLTHDSLVNAGDIKPRPDGRIISYPHLDRIPETTIIYAEHQSEMVGTISVTEDGQQGLYTDTYFREESAHIRQQFGGRLCATWRIATAVQYRGSRSLVLSLIRETFEVAKERAYDLCLFVFNQKHVKVYQQIIGAEVVAERVASVDRHVDLPLVLMKMDVQTGWERFKHVQLPIDGR